MYRLLAALALLACTLPAFSHPVAGVTSEPVSEVSSRLSDIELEAYIDGVMATYQAEHAAPGYTVSVVRSDRTVLAKGYGFADIAEAIPVDPNSTRFHVASISKTFVWTAAMILVERGVLDLDADVNQYLTSYQAPPGEAPITLNHLMAHRAGFEESLTVWVPEVAALSLPEAMAASEPRQVFPRGERTAYSNWGSNLVALVIQDVTDMPYSEFLYSEILNPLGMDTTVLSENSPNPKAADSELSKNYRVKNTGPEEIPQLDLGAFAPIGGMTITARDMATWMRFHLNQGELNGTRLLSKEAYAKMRTRAYDPVSGAAGRAHGFGDIPYRDSLYYGHTGSINAFLSKFIVSPDLDIGVFISQNTSDTFKPLSGLPRMIMDRELVLMGAQHPLLRPEPNDDDIIAAKTLAGSYVTSRRMYYGFDRIINITRPPLKLRAKDGLIFSGSSKAPYVRIAENLWENRLGNRIATVVDGDGKVLRLITPGGSVDMEPMRFSTNPMVLAVSLGLTVVFAVSSWLGLWRRFGHSKETSSTGIWLTSLALCGSFPILLLAIVGANIPNPDNVAFAEAFADWPIPVVEYAAMASTVIAIYGAIMLISTYFTWRSSQWNLLRKIHYSLFALSYFSLSCMLVVWGAAAYLPFV